MMMLKYFFFLFSVIYFVDFNLSDGSRFTVHRYWKNDILLSFSAVFEASIHGMSGGDWE